MIEQVALPGFHRAGRRVRKNVRKVSSGRYATLRDGTILKAAQARVFRCLAAYYNRFQQWPTRAELTEWMFSRREIPRRNINSVAPRISELLNGWHVKLPDGTRRRVGGGAVELLPVRRCRVNGDAAHPVRIRESGSTPDPWGYGGLF